MGEYLMGNHKVSVNRYGRMDCQIGDGSITTVHHDGTKKWYLNGKYHRVDGPAIEWFNGNRYWYLNGEWLSEEQHARWTSDG